MESNDVKKAMDQLWKKVKDDFDGLLKDSSVLIKKGEGFLKDVSQKGQTELEIVSLSLQREKLYYELGKIEGSIPKKRNAAKKKAAALAKIKKIDERIRKLKRKKR